MMNQMQFAPNQCMGNNLSNCFMYPQMNMFGINPWMLPYFNTQNNTMTPVGTINFVFKTSNGKTFTLLFNTGRTVEELILTFFRKIDQEYLFYQGGVTFVFNTYHIDYHSKVKVEHFFKFQNHPIIMVLDVNNLIGAQT